MVNKHTVDYHSSPSQLTSRIHPVIILWTPRGFISSESFLNFFLSLYIPSWLRKSFEYMVLRLLANRFISQKIESLHFYSCSQAKLSSRFFIKRPCCICSCQLMYSSPIPNGRVRCFFKAISPDRYRSGLKTLGSVKTYSSCKTEAMFGSISAPAGIVYQIYYSIQLFISTVTAYHLL